MGGGSGGPPTIDCEGGIIPNSPLGALVKKGSGIEASSSGGPCIVPGIGGGGIMGPDGGPLNMNDPDGGIVAPGGIPPPKPVMKGSEPGFTVMMGMLPIGPGGGNPDIADISSGRVPARTT